MADQYLQFSEALGNLSDEEHDWLQAQLEPVYVFSDQEYAEHEVPEHLSTADSSWCGYRAFRDLPDEEIDDEPGFQYDFCENRDLGRYLWLYAEEGGDPDRVAHLVQKFLRQFRPRECWSLTYAGTCSKPRLGEFSGGARFVTADRIQALDAYDFVDQCRAEFAAHTTSNHPS